MPHCVRTHTVTGHVLFPVWLLTPDTVPTPAQDYPGTAGHPAQFTQPWPAS
jgi:hypothetical protein